MKKAWIPLVAIVGLIFLVVSGFVGVANQMVSLDEGVKEKWAQVENVYQRRADLIPNLVNTVKGYAKHESQVFREVTEARAKVGQVQVGSLNDLPKFDQAQAGLSSALSRLLVVAERYPELKANTQFQELQSQIEGTENRISVERMRFNQAAREYNTYIRKFPQSMIAGMRGFQEKPYFTADPTARTAPKVEF
jgi:LemA protein